MNKTAIPSGRGLLRNSGHEWDATSMPSMTPPKAPANNRYIEVVLHRNGHLDDNDVVQLLNEVSILLIEGVTEIRIIEV